jgi:hypothetical protein
MLVTVVFERVCVVKVPRKVLSFFSALNTVQMSGSLILALVL